MERIGAVFILISFIGIAAFGFTAMHVGKNHTAGCIAEAVLNGAVCLNAKDALSLAIFHAQTFKNFSVAIFLFGIAMLLGALVTHATNRLKLPLLRSFFRKQFFETFVSPLEQKIIRWLALFINSPAIP